MKHLPKRSLIRRYIKARLKTDVDVGGRVFTNRDGEKIFQEELPAINFIIKNQESSVSIGSANAASVINRDMTVIVTIAIRNTDTDEGDADDSKVLLDYLAEQVSDSFGKDPLLAKLLEGYDPNSYSEGLALGTKENNEDLYMLVTDGPQFLGSEITFTISYDKDFYSKKRLYAFNSYHVDLIRPDSTESTVDRVLLGAEGEINE